MDQEPDVYQVLHVTRYDFLDERGNVLKGSKVTVLSNESVQGDLNSKGCEVVTMSAPYGVFPSFQQVPGFYKLNTVLKNLAGANGKKVAGVAVVGATFIGV
jgi:hypothetical protein